MTTSGIATFNVTRSEIIRLAATKLHAIDVNETMSSEEMADWNTHLNAMVKRWSKGGRNIRIWTIREATLFPQPGQIKYALSTTSTDHCAETYTSTLLDGAALSGQTALAVVSDDDIASGDQIGVELTTGSFHWTTVNGAPAGNVVTLTAALTDDADDGAAVFAYTSNIIRPLGLAQGDGGVRRYTIASGQDVPIGSPIARLEYQSLPNKAQTGTVSQVFYDPQLTTGYLYLWQAPSTPISDLIKFTWHRPIEDFASAGDNPDLPQEWIDTLIYNLAVVRAPDFDVSTERFSMISALAEQFLDEVSGADREPESIFFAPDFS